MIKNLFHKVAPNGKTFRKQGQARMQVQYRIMMIAEMVNGY